MMFQFLFEKLRLLLELIVSFYKLLAKKYSVILHHFDILLYLCKPNKHYNNIWKR